MVSVSILASSLIQDYANLCSTEAAKDVSRLKRRYENEGLSFLTITLPKFLDDVMFCIEKDEVVSNAFLGWKKRLGLPIFLSGFLKLIFAEDGKVNKDDDTAQITALAIKAVRGICLFAKKIQLPCSSDRTKHAIREYSHVDNQLDQTVSKIEERLILDFSCLSNTVMSMIFKEPLDVESLIPYHGPGSTADKLRGNQKYNAGLVTWPSWFNSFNYGNTMYNTEESMYLDQTVLPDSANREKLPARLSTVIKTQLKPRIIAMEPTAIQMCQQSIKDYLVRTIEECPLTKDHINFTDQEINRRLALENSRTRRLATLDLSMASDRVHNDLVYLMFSTHPILRDILFETRSEWIDINGELMKLNKFASMGSATCFPVEAVFFYIICLKGLLDKRNLTYTERNIKLCTSDIYVYGDDILVPVDEVDAVISELESFGNKVGLTKSFIKSNFRESCGMDAFNGVDITPIYLRHPVPTQQKGNAGAIISLVSTANQLITDCLCKTAKTLACMVTAITGPLPIVEMTSPALGWFDPDLSTGKPVKSRYNYGVMRKEVLAPTLHLIKKTDKCEGYSALAKCLVNMEVSHTDETYPNSSLRNMLKKVNAKSTDHLDKSVGLDSLTLKRRWLPVH